MAKILNSDHNINDKVEFINIENNNVTNMIDMYFYSSAACCSLQLMSKSLRMSDIPSVSAMGDVLFIYARYDRERIILTFRGTQKLSIIFTDASIILDTYTTIKLSLMFKGA
ncbi:hypothetical protein CONCODRAFT_4844 [Conidiobolus coronatus NRRL 28638]|uniref:Uncharacterized protein n=1 Tax=Conidiobolus coronatus (strain ATCC 28846 / CBS 209.66 / NRRL 28638) TaxID=796925 RepID=A0A137PBM7_CONC2|nr:hypothetical protein CONCODRAFT_4844 [Conidiobolus coronatus NRRL 28638]|eukprot:KXN72400.1 hypothetical protein CONCODRAFT_4844 [Conidiobolus coronatus NRRL 28638]